MGNHTINGNTPGSPLKSTQLLAVYYYIGRSISCVSEPMPNTNSPLSN